MGNTVEMAGGDIYLRSLVDPGGIFGMFYEMVIFIFVASKMEIQFDFKEIVKMGKQNLKS